MVKFSVIIALYNKAPYIESTLNSVLAQTYTDFEIIIADDGSTDGSAKIVKSFKDKRIKYFYKENEGVSAARNFAIDKANGNYFAFLDADDIWHNDHLLEINNIIIAMPHISAFATLLKSENKYGEYMPVYTNLTKDKLQENDFFTLSFARTILSSSTTVVSRDVCEKTGWFDVSLKKNEDTDYWIRIGTNYRIGVVNKVTALQRYVPQSLSNSKFSNENIMYFEKFAELEKNNADAKKMIDINRYALALRCKMNGNNAALKKMVSLIASENISFKQKILLHLPAGVLHFLQKLKQFINAKF